VSAKPTLVQLILNATTAGKSMLTAANAAAQKTLLSLVKGDVGLGNVDNTSDASKPVSSAQQTALDAKQATLVSATNIKTVSSVSLLGSGDVPIDMLSTLAAAESSVTGTTTATISRMHVCSGTTADYTITLPAASGNTGKLIGFRMSNALTQLVTLDGNASETIDGLTTRVMWAGESAILLCDGSNWFKIAGKSIPLEAVAEARSSTSMVNNTTTRVNLTDTLRQSVSTLVDLPNDRITVPRAGTWIITGLVSYQLVGASVAGSESYAQFGINGTTTSSLPAMLTVVPTSYAASGTFNGSHCALCCTRKLSANDFVVLIGYQSSGQTFTTRTVDVVRPFLSLLEVPSW
jgi:hypothetical protein